MIKKVLVYTLATLLVLTGIDAAAQGDLSSQVLRLLERDNTWTGVNIFDAAVGIVLGDSGMDPTEGTANTLYNKGGNLYFNGSVLAGGGGGGAGTVTSVALTLPSLFSVTGSPVTSDGTLIADLATQAANQVFAGPTTGADDTPAFRALVAADIPDISSTYVTPAGAAALTNKTGLISQWTNDVGYITTTGGGGTGITTVGTVTTGTWNADVVAGLYGGTGVANSGKTITLGGNLTTSGANNVTFTTSGATNVTLPTSGTLITSSVTSLSSLVTVGTIGSGTWQGTAVGAAYGGTGNTTYTIGDLIYASGTTTLSKLAGVATGNALISGGVATAPSWGKVGLATHTTGTLPNSRGGTNLDTSAVTNGQILMGKTSDNSWNLGTITGTADQINVTNGAGSITLSLAQAVSTTSTPRFNKLGLGTGAGGTAVLTTTGQINTGYLDDGNSGTSANINWNQGMVQKITMNNNCTFAFSNPITGVAEYRLDVVQDGTGSRIATWPGTVTWRGGSAPTLTTTAGKTDICTFKWNGSVYFGDCSLNY